ncbi:MAG: glycosyltransferase family 2 protein [Candidatus Ratteibacteria bacterium]|jgi:abequosyltransferase
METALSKTENSSDKIKISVCITTRNRANLIGESLESIISQADDNIEIVVVDGASTDNTAEVVRKYQSKFRNLVYRRLEKNGGVDLDMAQAIKLSRGEYCWLFSDDDALKTNAIKRMLEEIKSGYEIYLCNITTCDLKMRPLRNRLWLSANIKDRVFNLHDNNELTEYCDSANSIGALFSYWSSIVLRRQEWTQSGYQHDFDGTAYALAASLFSFTKRKCRLKYIRDSLVLWRNDNESFQNTGGLVKRFLLDFDGYLKLADKFLSEDLRAKKAFLKVMTREHPWYTIINVTSFINSPALWRQFRDNLLKFGYSPGLAAACYALGRHKKLVSLAVSVKRKIVKSRRVNKIVEFLNIFRK